MVGRRLACLGLLALAACAKEESTRESMVTPSERVAWCGESEQWRVVLEALAPVHESADARQSEESMLREQLPLDEAEVLLRLHVLGPAKDLEEIGAVELGGEALRAFPAAEADWSPRQRLLWDGIVRGLPLPDAGETSGRRTVLLQGSLDPWSVPTAQWSRRNAQLELQRRTWTENERRAFFDAAELTPIDE